MSYIIHYDICALVILTTLLILFSLSRRRVWFAQNMLFLYLLLATFVSSAVNVFAAVLDGNVRALGWCWFLNIMDLTMDLCIAGLSVVYYLYLTHRLGRLSKAQKVLVAAPLIAAECLLLLTPLSHWVFRMDEEARLCTGPLYGVFIAVLGLYALLWATIVVMSSDAMPRFNKTMHLLFGISVLAAIIVRGLFASVHLVNLTMTMCLAVLYFTTQSANGYVDVQTKAYARPALISALDGYFEQKKPVWLLIFSLESMEKVNTVFGGTCSDQLLFNVAEYLSCLYPGKMVVRLSGKRFGVLLNGMQNVEQLKIELREFPEIWTIGNSQVSIVSTKAALFSESFSGAEEMLAVASNVTRLTSNNPAHIVIVDESVGREYVRPMMVEAALERAIAAKSFEMYYQPIFTVADGKLCAAEALLRMTDKELGSVSPGEFIPIAERVGLARQVGVIVREKVLEMVARERPQDFGLDHISVNLSVIECVQDNIASELREQLAQYDVPPSLIHLEITETASALTDAMLFENMDKLAEAGFCLHLDDYGTGYSNLMRLLEMPLDTIKLDRSLLRSINTEPRRRFLGAHIASLHAMHVHVLCEGIETLDELQMVDEWSADYGQGYLYSKPLNEATFVELMHQLAGH